MRKEMVLPVIVLVLCSLSCNFPSGDADVAGDESGTPAQPPSNAHMEEPYVDEQPGEALPTAYAGEEEDFDASEPGETSESGEIPEAPALPCVLTSAEARTVYTRPDTSAAVFGTLGAGTELPAAARTSDGWWGFDPGVAQAGNVGVFRYRWIEGGEDMSMEGGCSVLPVVEGPEPGVCFTMPMGDVPVYSEPDTASSQLMTMTGGDYAAVTGRSTDGWVRLDLAIGNSGTTGTGWMEGSYLNMNGPCDDIMEVTP